MMAVDVSTQAGFVTSKPKVLFDGPFLPTTGTFPFYDVTPDGQRFLMLKEVAGQAAGATQINVILNWLDEWKRRAPAGR